jgi:methionyl-tRNA formyltransferase
VVSHAPLRVVFFGTPAFAVPAFEALLASRHRVAGVVTQPDRPRGRGQKTIDLPVKTRARGAGVPLLQPSTLSEPSFMAALAALEADIGVVAAYGKILSERVLAMPRLGMINVHASLLPRYRGAAPVHRAVIAGERETGVTIMRVIKALDAGPMLAQSRRPVGPNETSEEVERDLSRIGAALLTVSLDRLAAGDVSETPQDDAAATYAHRLTKQDGLIDWTWPADRIHNLVRGLHPWPHAYTYLNGARLIILRSVLANQSHGVPPGSVVTAHGDELRIAAGSEAVGLLQIQAEGKRPMSPRDFLAGHRLRLGDRFARTP